MGERLTPHCAYLAVGGISLFPFGATGDRGHGDAVRQDLRLSDGVGAYPFAFVPHRCHAHPVQRADPGLRTCRRGAIRESDPDRTVADHSQVGKRKIHVLLGHLHARGPPR